MELQIEQDEAFQRHEWRVERLGWALVTLFVLAGLFGLLGPGPFSRTTVAAGSVEVEYDRISHYEADDAVTITFAPSAVDGGTVTARLTGAWPQGISLEGISPEPSEQRIVPGGVELEFLAEEDEGELQVSITFRSQELGVQDAQLAVGPDTLSFSQLVLP